MPRWHVFALGFTKPTWGTGQTDTVLPKSVWRSLFRCRRDRDHRATRTMRQARCGGAKEIQPAVKNPKSKAMSQMLQSMLAESISFLRIDPKSHRFQVGTGGNSQQKLKKKRKHGRTSQKTSTKSEKQENRRKRVGKTEGIETEEPKQKEEQVRKNHEKRKTGKQKEKIGENRRNRNRRQN